MRAPIPKRRSRSCSTTIRPRPDRAPQTQMLSEVNKLTAGSDGKLDKADYERTVKTLLTGGSAGHLQGADRSLHDGGHRQGARQVGARGNSLDWKIVSPFAQCCDGAFSAKPRSQAAFAPGATARLRRAPDEVMNEAQLLHDRRRDDERVEIGPAHGPIDAVHGDHERRPGVDNPLDRTLCIGVEVELGEVRALSCRQPARS